MLLLLLFAKWNCHHCNSNRHQVLSWLLSFLLLILTTSVGPIGFRCHSFLIVPNSIHGPIPKRPADIIWKLDETNNDNPVLVNHEKENDENDDDHDDHSSTLLDNSSSTIVSQNAASIRFLGKGPNALVREGVVLIAPMEEYNHYLMRACIFVYDIKLEQGKNINENEDPQQPIIQCVVLDNPTPFTMNEMMATSSSKTTTSESSFSILNNLLYRGGNLGGEAAMMFHSVKELNRPEIGCSGIYQGGLEQALQWQQQVQFLENEKNACNISNKFKFFFNYCEFTATELETMLSETVDPITGDAWVSVEVAPEIILAEWDKNECWRYLRRAVR